ncbi:MAG: T9SS type A sorting domain-containing protein, partial [Flavipsychrobacter sp.]
TATGTGITYQWQVNTGAGFINITPASYYHGINTSTLSITNTSATLNNYQYRCVVSGVCTPQAISVSATLIVNRLPAIISQTPASYICEGDNTSFSVVATGTGLTYQWQLDNGAGGVNLTNGTLYSGVNTPTLTITNAASSMTNQLYRCIVSGTCTPPAISADATLKVYSHPRLIQDLTDLTGCENGSVRFMVDAKGDNIVYQWQVNDGTGFVNVPTISTYSGANTRILNVSGIMKSMANYQYRCIVSGMCSPSVTSSTGTLTVDTLPVVVSNPVDVTICEGNNTTFTAAGTGTGLRYVWQIDMGSGFTNLDNSTIYSGARTPVLTITNAAAWMNGYQYRCTIYGACAPVAISSAAKLTVNTAPGIKVQPANTTVCNTASTTMPFTATGTALTYQWQVNTGAGFTNLTDNPPYSGTTTSSLSITNANMSMNNYSYRCVVTGICTPPATTWAAKLTVTNTTQWTGAVDNKWSNPSNWSCGIIPIATTNVYIPAVSNNPVVDIGNAICDSISIDNTSSLSFSSPTSSLEIKGAFLNAGGFDPSAGSVIFSGDQPQTIPAATYYALHLKSAADKNLVGNTAVTNTLDLSNGNLLLGNSNISIGSTAAISGGNMSSYIVTNGTGTVREINVGVGTSKTGMLIVPVGVDNSYTPLSFTNTGDIDNFDISVKTKVYNNYGYTFQPYGSPITSEAVNKTWYLNEEVAGGSNVTVSLQWNVADELNNFNRHACYVAPYIIPNWQPAAAIIDADVANSSGPYTASLSGINTFPVFGVGSPFAGSTTYTPRGGTVKAYPNPNSGSTVYASFDIAPSNNVNIYIVDLFGTNSLSVHVNPYDYTGAIIPLDITGLTAGEYILKVVDVGSNNEVRTTRFIKL